MYLYFYVAQKDRVVVTCNMLKKYLPYIMLIAAALLLFFIKKNQRGTTPEKPITEQTEDGAKAILTTAKQIQLSYN